MAASSMIRGQSPDDICSLCDEYSVKLATSEYAAIGMGRCGITEEGKPHRHVAWDQYVCISFRLDRPNLARRRQYVAQQKRVEEDAKNK